LHCGVLRKPAPLDILDRPYRRSDAIHVYPGRIGRYLRDRSGVLVVGLELQFGPTRHELGAQSQRAAEALGRDHRLIRGLPVGEEDPGESEDKVGTLIQRHENDL
jgi:hypothetical protein